MNKVYHTGVKLYSYEITVTPKGGVGVERIVTLDNLPHSSHEEFARKVTDALINLGIAFSQHHITTKLK